MTNFKHHRMTWEALDQRVGGAQPPKPVAPPPPPPPPPKPVAPAAAQAPAATSPAPARDQADLRWENSVRTVGLDTDAGSPVRAAVQVALRQLLTTQAPKDDAGQTHSRHQPCDAHGQPRDRDFGHRPVDLGPLKPGGKEPGPSLYALNTATPGQPAVVWADNGRRLTGAQWAAMEPGQRERVASHVAPAEREAFTQAMDAQAQAFPDPKANPAVRPDLLDRLQDAGTALKGAWSQVQTRHEAGAAQRERLARDQAPLPEQAAAAKLNDRVEAADRLHDAFSFEQEAAGKLRGAIAERAEAGRRVAATPPGTEPPAAPDAPDAPDAPESGTFESRLGVVTGGLGTLMGLTNVYNDFQQLAADGDGWRALDITAHTSDVLGGLGDVAQGLAGSGLDMSGRLGTVVEALNTPLAQRGFQVVGGVGLMADGAADMKSNAEAFAKKPTFGNTLGFEIGAMKTSAGAAITSGHPVAVVYGEGLALTAGGLEVMKHVYDSSDTVRGAIDNAGEFHQQWMGSLYCATQGIPQEVSAAPVKLPPTPAGGWGHFMATHSQAEVAQYYADHGQRAPGT